MAHAAPCRLALWSELGQPLSPVRHQSSTTKGKAKKTKQQDTEDSRFTANGSRFMHERLQKILSRAGVASRRKAEEMIEQGRVRVNGQIIRELGSKADPEQDYIKVDGKLLRLSKQPPLYLMLNKPRGCVTTRHDPEGRSTVMDLLGRYRSKVYPVGRLDYHSEGLLLFTNDGEFADGVLSAKSQVPKTYQVKIKGNPGKADLEKLRQGIRLDGRPTAPAKIRLLRRGDNPWYEVTLIEGRNNQIRRMFQKCGFPVEKLKRVKIGPLSLSKLPVRKFRLLTPKEVAGMRRRWSVAAGTLSSPERALPPARCLKTAQVKAKGKNQKAKGKRTQRRRHDSR